MTKFDASQANKRWISVAVLAALFSWAGWWSVLQLPINGLTKGLFFVLLFVAVAATLMPALAYLNARFGRFVSPRVYQMRFVRQSLLAGAFAVASAWLQMQRVLSSSLFLILLAVFVLVETFLITREMPPQESP